MEIISRSEALRLGSRFYFTGKACKNGHVCLRRVVGWNCTECGLANLRKAYQTNPERARTRRREWDRANPARAKELRLKACEKRRDANREAAATWRLANPERSRANNRAWRLANPDRAKQIAARWRQANPERKSQLSARYSLRKRGNGQACELTDFVVDEAVLKARRLEQLTGYKWHVDHMIPLSKCGLHRYDNIQVIPAWLNLWKHNKLVLTRPGEWLDHCT